MAMLSVFIDPAAAAKRVPAKLSWLWPLIVLSIIYLVVGYLMVPYAMQFADVRISQTIAQQGVPPDRIENASRIAHQIV